MLCRNLPGRTKKSIKHLTQESDVQAEILTGNLPIDLHTMFEDMKCEEERKSKYWKGRIG